MQFHVTCISVVKTTCCSSREPGFKSHHPHGSSQASVTPVPEHLFHLAYAGNKHTSNGQRNMQAKHLYIFLKTKQKEIRKKTVHA